MEKNRQAEDSDEILKGHNASMESDYLRAAEALKVSKNIIKEFWEERVREKILAAEAKSSIVMVNSLSLFLDKLAISLEQKIVSLEIFSEAVGMGKTHGGERAHFSGYYLPQLLKEFSILREVLVEVLQAKGVLTYDVRGVIDRTIDLSTSLAATEFAKVQNEKTETALLRAEMSNRDLEHFAAVAAHDLKSPLATISGYLALLNDEFKIKLGDDGLKHVQLMMKASERMLNLIDHLLEYARLTKVDITFKAVNTTDVVKAVIQNLDDAIKKMNAKVTYKSLPIILGEFDLLVQLFQNLIANSIKFHSKTPLEIQIELEEKDNMWIFSVRDNGVGFDPKDREDIFALYKKLHGSKYQGAGIGLATCRKVVELHGGKIWAESKPGSGSTFYFSLPKTKTENEAYH
ncbi:sensor histidine kinase [Pseudobdellovibrio sp. HCB154]|uniref:sensor histidine kinase n=1 Tax=Pseudobdellovibrio sp. HCB154 TaxID=3386277 RepID=UPI0039170AD5